MSHSSRLESDPRFVSAMSSRVVTNTARDAIRKELETAEGRKRLEIIWKTFGEQADKFNLEESTRRTLDAAHLHRKKARGLRVAYIELLTAASRNKLEHLSRQNRRHVQDITQGELELQRAAS